MTTAPSWYWKAISPHGPPSPITAPRTPCPTARTPKPFKVHTAPSTLNSMIMAITTLSWAAQLEPPSAIRQIKAVATSSMAVQAMIMSTPMAGPIPSTAAQVPTVYMPMIPAPPIQFQPIPMPMSCTATTAMIRSTVRVATTPSMAVMHPPTRQPTTRFISITPVPTRSPTSYSRNKAPTISKP